MESSNREISTINHYNGFDWLRALMSIFVVVWHMKGAGSSALFSNDAFSNHSYSLSDFINFQLLLLAVPIFILISTFLFSSQTRTIGYLFGKFKRFFLLFLFWVLTLKLWHFGYSGMLTSLPQSFSELVSFFLTGDDTVYYFFTSLIICLMISYLLKPQKTSIQIVGFILSVIGLLALPKISLITGNHTLSAFWNPLNFIPYSFAGLLLVRFEKILKGKAFPILLSIVLCALFAMLEWSYYTDRIFIIGQGFALPAYTRVSVLFGAISSVIIAMNVKKEAGKLIKFMASYSLALYILHPFLMKFVPQVFPFLADTESLILIWISILSVIILSYLAAYLLKKYILKTNLIF